MPHAAFLAPLVLFATCCNTSGANEDQRSRPNVLIISIDDLNDWVGCLGGHPQAKTPNIDRLAKQGTLFANAHCQAPVCTPSRAAMVTGLMPARTGLYFLQPELTGSEIARNQPLLMESLSGAGYQTLAAGKFVHSRDESVYFDQYGGRFGGFGPLPAEKLNYPDGLKLWDWGAHPANDQEMPDWSVADWVIKQLAKRHDKPFFLVAGFWRPHVPLYVPKKWHDLFPIDKIELPRVLENDRDDLPEYAKDLTVGFPAPRHEWFLRNRQWKSAVQSYLASVAFVDHCVGRVLDQLESSPHHKNTIVVLLSDHGWHLGEKARWAKRSLWTDGTHVPLIISAPGYPAGQVTTSPAGLIDLYPTILELTGVDNRKLTLDGHSLAPQLRDPTALRPQPSICTFGPGNHSLHFSRWHYIRYADGSEELYDRQEDPDEWHNLASDPAHKERLILYREQVPVTNAQAIRYEKRLPWEYESWQNAERNAAIRRSEADPPAAR